MLSKPAMEGIPSRIVAAEKKHIPAMAAILAAAFIDEPALSWILPNPGARADRLTIFFEAILCGTLSNGIALRSPDDEAVALLRLPRRIHPGFFETLGALPKLMHALGDGQKRARLLSQSLRAHEPRDFPYWYLQFVGVAPSHQQQGWGGIAVRACLAKARAAAMPVYLETPKRTNVSFYKHLGFEMLDTWEIPDSGLHFTSLLWRP